VKEKSLERETGIEPATFSLGRRPSIENKEHSVHLHLVLAIRNPGFLLWDFYASQMEHKWSTRTAFPEGFDSQIQNRTTATRIRSLGFFHAIVQILLFSTTYKTTVTP
jgi:hypothetical protein